MKIIILQGGNEFDVTVNSAGDLTIKTSIDSKET